ncbi:transmembrane 4 L6 family member 19 [Ctenodactylus gundi]
MVAQAAPTCAELVDRSLGQGVGRLRGAPGALPAAPLEASAATRGGPEGDGAAARPDTSGQAGWAVLGPQVRARTAEAALPGVLLATWILTGGCSSTWYHPASSSHKQLIWQWAELGGLVGPGVNCKRVNAEEGELAGPPVHLLLMLFCPGAAACSRTCSRILGLSLVTTALCAAGANLALLFPNWDVTCLPRGLVGRHALLGSGLWGGGLMVLTAATLISMTSWRRCCCSWSTPCHSMLAALLSSSLALFGALICFITSGVALKDGPFCMFDASVFNQTQAWKYGYPFKALQDRNYLYDHSLWDSVCLEPSKAVVWHVSFFSVLLCVTVLQLLLVALHFINSFLSLFCSLCDE